MGLPRSPFVAPFPRWLEWGPSSSDLPSSVLLCTATVLLCYRASVVFLSELCPSALWSSSVLLSSTSLHCDHLQCFSLVLLCASSSGQCTLMSEKCNREWKGLDHYHSLGEKAFFWGKSIFSAIQALSKQVIFFPIKYLLLGEDLLQQWFKSFTDDDCAWCFGQYRQQGRPLRLPQS